MIEAFVATGVAAGIGGALLRRWRAEVARKATERSAEVERLAAAARQGAQNAADIINAAYNEALRRGKPLVRPAQPSVKDALAFQRAIRRRSIRTVVEHIKTKGQP